MVGPDGAFVEMMELGREKGFESKFRRGVRLVVSAL
jgi:hypothetical protein